MANVCRKERDIDNRTRTLESTKDLLRCPKILWTLATNGLKSDRSFYPPWLFRFVAVIAHPLCFTNVAPHSDSKWNGIGFVCSSGLKPQNMWNWKCYRIRRPSVAIHRYNCHLSSYSCDGLHVCCSETKLASSWLLILSVPSYHCVKYSSQYTSQPSAYGSCRQSCTWPSVQLTTWLTCNKKDGATFNYLPPADYILAFVYLSVCNQFL